jgi:hypothetical protein
LDSKSNVLQIPSFEFLVAVHAEHLNIKLSVWADSFALPNCSQIFTSINSLAVSVQAFAVNIFSQVIIVVRFFTLKRLVVEHAGVVDQPIARNDSK